MLEDYQWVIMLQLTKLKTFTDLIRETFRPAIMENEVRCDICQTISKRTEKIPYIKRLPPYLIVGINLTNFNHQREQSEKILQRVNAPMKISTQQVFKEVFPNANDEIYKLYAIIIHKGYSSDSGHYYTIARNLDKSDNNNDKSWYIFNDRDVVKIGKKLNLEIVLQNLETPYLFFFEKKNKKELVASYDHTIRMN